MSNMIGFHAIWFVGVTFLERLAREIEISYYNYRKWGGGGGMQWMEINVSICVIFYF